MAVANMGGYWVTQVFTEISNLMLDLQQTIFLVFIHDLTSMERCYIFC